MTVWGLSRLPQVFAVGASMGLLAHHPAKRPAVPASSPSSHPAMPRQVLENGLYPPFMTAGQFHRLAAAVSASRPVCSQRRPTVLAGLAGEPLPVLAHAR